MRFATRSERPGLVTGGAPPSRYPAVTWLDADRATSNCSDRDSDDGPKRLARQRDRESFSVVQVLAEGSGDLPDNDDGVREPWY